jgi:hypothetical protein
MLQDCVTVTPVICCICSERWKSFLVAQSNAACKLMNQFAVEWPMLLTLLKPWGVDTTELTGYHPIGFKEFKYLWRGPEGTSRRENTNLDCLLCVGQVVSSGVCWRQPCEYYKQERRNK